MKPAKTLIAVLSAAVLLTGGIGSYAAADTGYKTAAESRSDETGYVKTAVDNRSSELNSLINNKVRTWISSFSAGSDGYIFPDHYSGCYHEEDGTLVIMSSNIPELKKTYGILRVKCPYVKLVEVQYSRNELQKIGDSYCETMPDFYTYGVNERLNKVVFTASEELCEEHSRIAAEKGLPIVFEVGTRVDGSFA